MTVIKDWLLLLYCKTWKQNNTTPSEQFQNPMKKYYKGAKSISLVHISIKQNREQIMQSISMIYFLNRKRWKINRNVDMFKDRLKRFQYLTSMIWDYNDIKTKPTVVTSTSCQTQMIWLKPTVVASENLLARMVWLVLYLEKCRW